jgi:His-Xaa-Ser system protein HxsD
MSAGLSWVQSGADGVSIRIDLAIYPLDIVLRACHPFTARCYVFARDVEDGTVTVEFAPRNPGESLRDLAGEYSNALLDYRLRRLIADETRVIRELLVAQAFCEADLLDRRQSESDEYADPRGIAQ